MTSIFLFALIVGGGLLALSFLGDLFGFGDADLDAELDTDLVAEAEVSAEAEGAADGAPAVHEAVDFAGAFRIFTIRNLTYFLFGFGAVGWLMAWRSPEMSDLLVLAGALIAGLVAAALATLTFGLVRATESGYRPDEWSFVGCEGRVVLPLGHGKMGQIVVRREDREHELRALPFDASAVAPGDWRSVMVIEMSGGTALVSPMEALAPAENEPADH